MPFGFDSIGKSLIYIGLILVIIGLVLHFGSKFISLGRLPGDIHLEQENFGFNFPITTSILLSIVLTIILNFISRR